jgi:hypothetical protein
MKTTHDHPHAEHRRRIRCSPATAQQRIGEAAKTWGADWQPEESGGRLILPVLAGIRKGWVAGPLFFEARGHDTEVELRVEESRYQLHIASVVVLLVSALGGLAVMAWPFLGEQALPLAAVGAILALCGWFGVVSKIRIQSPEHFLEMLDEEIEEAG